MAAERSDKPLDLSSLPDLGAPSLDAHSHLDMLEDPAGALARAALVGVELVLTVVDLSESGVAWLDTLPGLLDEAATELRRHGSQRMPPEVRLVVGVHPHNASAYSPTMAKEMTRLAAREDVVAFGEVGLDFHYDHSPREVQLEMFRDQLRLAHEAGLPVIVHLRESHEIGERILREEGVPEAGCVLHCFTEGPRWAERFLGMGCHVSFSGLVTFKRAELIRQAAAAVPLDRLLIETDAPFLAPEPFRGRANEPALSVLAAAKVAEVKGVPPAELAAAASANARDLFGVDGRLGG